MKSIFLSLFVVVVLFCVPLLGQYPSGQIIQQPAPIVQPVQQPVEQATPKEVAKSVTNSGFRIAVFKAIRTARKNGIINRREASRLRVAMFSPAALNKAEDLAVFQLAFYDGEDAPDLKLDTSGKIDRTAIDWNGFAGFLERLLPLILAMLDAFAKAEIDVSELTAIFICLQLMEGGVV